MPSRYTQTAFSAPVCRRVVSHGRLLEVFNHYARSGDGAKSRANLDGAGFRRLVRECPGLLGGALDLAAAERAFNQVNRPAADFSEFLCALTTLAAAKFPDAAADDGVFLLLKHHIAPLHGWISEQRGSKNPFAGIFAPSQSSSPSEAGVATRDLDEEPSATPGPKKDVISLQSPPAKRSDARYMLSPSQVEEVFERYAAFPARPQSPSRRPFDTQPAAAAADSSRGGTRAVGVEDLLTSEGGGGTLDGAAFARLSRDCPGLLGPGLKPAGEPSRSNTPTPHPRTAASPSAHSLPAPATDVDVVFASVCPRGLRRIGFTLFLDALAALAARKFPGAPVPEALRSLLTQHLAPLHAAGIGVAPRSPRNGHASPSGGRGLRSTNAASDAVPGSAAASAFAELLASPAVSSASLAQEAAPPSAGAAKSPALAAPAAGNGAPSSAAPSPESPLRNISPLRSLSVSPKGRLPERSPGISPDSTTLMRDLQAARERSSRADAEVARLQAALSLLSSSRQADAERSASILRALAAEADTRLFRARAAHGAEVEREKAQRFADAEKLEELRTAAAALEERHAAALAALAEDHDVKVSSVDSSVAGAARTAMLDMEQRHATAIAVLTADHDAKLSTVEASRAAAALSASEMERRAKAGEARLVELAESLKAMQADSMLASSETRQSWNDAMTSFAVKLADAERARAAAERRADAAEALAQRTAEVDAVALDATVAALRADLMQTSDAHLRAELRASQALIQLEAAEKRHASACADLRAERAAREQGEQDIAAAVAAAERRAEGVADELARLSAELEKSASREVTLRADVLQLRDAVEAGRNRESAISAELAECQAELVSAVREHQALSDAHVAALDEQLRLATLVSELETNAAAHATREADFEGELEALHLATIAARAEADAASASAGVSSEAHAAGRLTTAETAMTRLHAVEDEALALRARVRELEDELTATRWAASEARARADAVEEAHKSSQRAHAESDAATAATIDSLKRLLRESADALRAASGIEPGIAAATTAPSYVELGSRASEASDFSAGQPGHPGTGSAGGAGKDASSRPVATTPGAAFADSGDFQPVEIMAARVRIAGLDSSGTTAFAASTVRSTGNGR